VTFADAGTFTVSVEYVSSDIAYSNATIGKTLTFVVA
jgi:hypothetical protein